jgi:predicted RNase H-like HicB family nuclease
VKRKHFPIIIEQDADDVFIVTCPVFKGCHSYGYTIDEAIKNITEAISCCAEDTIKDVPKGLLSKIIRYDLEMNLSDFWK